MKLSQIQKYYDKENDSSHMISQRKSKKPCSKKHDNKLKVQTPNGQGGVVNQYTDILINIPPEALQNGTLYDIQRQFKDPESALHIPQTAGLRSTRAQSDMNLSRLIGSHR
jgi:hypothetical protein